uniref:transposase n=1 Tax=Microbacterium sp. BF1 TaxID=2821146 RepID=UPI0035AB73DC
MPKEQTSGKPTTRRYSPEEKTAAVRMVRTLRAELGTEHGTVHRVAAQLGYGVESVRMWVKQADIDDVPGSRATLVGQSMGAHTAFLAAAARPDLADGLVMLEGHVSGSD